MNHFEYRDGILHAEDVAISAIAEAVGTPFYVYSTATLERHYRVFADAFSQEGLDALVCYAVKANSNLSVIRTLAQLGAGADVVSEGELRRALAAGVPPEKIVFSGVGKTVSELEFALNAGILEINVESLPELEMLSDTAQRLGREAHVAIRVNPDVDAKTHEKIATGKKENKFGIDIEYAGQIYARAANLPGIKPVSIAVHIGSQLTSLDPYRAAFAKLAETVETLQKQGIGIERLDLGGGLGIPYDASDSEPPLPSDYAKVVRESVGHLNLPIMLEPGRLIVGNSGLLVTEVILEKVGETRRFVIVDAAMNDLIRPSLYDGHHEIMPVREPAENAQKSAADVVGPVCESGDTFAKNRQLPPLDHGDLVAFGSAGAYGAVMASTYNTRLLVPEVLVKGDQFAVIRPRQTYEELLALDHMAEWLD
ncbi:diaminopimelate decarboxylase [Aestuariispira insulae]|uniref:Diaminopimelate decarboxylase n=1 Tax=Aestuariispira insulae TaxID=1461337 RepID=A0A3D9H6D9_9PROT|nr:diaminopimelate decarboxylase [Aestuariispira insulae]RED45060.1 diaminopimelate decarboxylase [Aestuariispira insulae]